MARNQRAAALKAWETRRRNTAGTGKAASSPSGTAKLAEQSKALTPAGLGLPPKTGWRKNPFGGEWLMVGSRKFRVAPNHLVGPDRVIKRRWQVEGREGFFDSPEAAKEAVERLARGEG